MANLYHRAPGACTRRHLALSRIGNVDTFLRSNLTGGAKGGVHVTGVTNASRTQLLSLKTLD
jgi:glycerol kinase